MQNNNLQLLQTETNKDYSFICEIAKKFLEEAERGNVKSCSLVWERTSGVLAHSRCSRSMYHTIAQLELLKLRLSQEMQWVQMEK